MARPELSIRVSADPAGGTATAQRDRGSQSRSPPPRDTISPILVLPAALSRATSPPITRPTPPLRLGERPTPPPKDAPNWSPESRLTLPSAVSSPPSNARLLDSSPDSAQLYLYRNSAAAATASTDPWGREKGGQPKEVLLKEAWRPSWFRKRVLGPFVLVFALLVVAGELVLCLGNGKTANTTIEGLWTFSPVISECNSINFPDSLHY